MVSVRPTASASFKTYQRDFHHALEDEIKALRRAGGSMTPVTDGHYLGSRHGEHLYSFTTDNEIRFPEDAPIDLYYQNNKHPGTLVSVEGFDLLIAIEENIGKNIKRAKLNTEPWFLLKELQNRLGKATVSDRANRKLAEALLIASPRSTPTNDDKLDNYTLRIASETGLSLQYNTHQSDAVTHVLQHPVSFIWGPPGTGKTSTLGLAVASLVYSGQSVLVLAHSNAAVDTAIKSVGKYLCKSSYYNAGMVLRFGIPTAGTYQQYPKLSARGIVKEQQPKLVEDIEILEKKREQLTKESRIPGLTVLRKNQLKDQLTKIRQQLQPLKKELRQHESVLISKGMVVGCTLSKAAIAKEIFERQFDAVIIDEASMAYIPHCAYGATLAKKRIAIFGDFRQLAPVSQAKTDTAKEYLHRDIFDEAGIIGRVNKQTADPRLVLLKTQYRMHPSISAIPNELFYGNQLKDGVGVGERTQKIVELFPYAKSSLIFHDLSRTLAFCCSEDHSSRFNIVSALIATDIAYRTQSSGNSSVALITPYRAQARLLHRILRETGQKNVKAATVHRFQGSEQDIIIFDAVDSYPQKKASKLLKGGAQSTAARLSNVAISRAQGKFIGLFNDAFLKDQLDSFNIFYKFIHRLRSCSRVVPISFARNKNSQTRPWSFALPNVIAYPDAKAAQADIQSDFIAAEDAIAIDWPVPLRVDQHFQLKFQQGLKLFVRGPYSNAIAKGFRNSDTHRKQSFSNMGIVGIDGQVLWIYASPNTSGPVFKVTLPETVTLLYDFLELTPSDNRKSIEKDLKQNKHAFGVCELCNNPLWPQPGKRGFARVSCVKHPRQGRHLTPTDATRYAQLSRCLCPKCQSSMRGVKSSATGKVFLTCSRSSCNGSAKLDDIL